MSEFIITFGPGHHDRYKDLNGCFTRIKASSWGEAKHKVNALRKGKWQGGYETRNGGEAIVKIFGYKEIQFAEIGPQIGENL